MKAVLRDKGRGARRRNVKRGTREVKQREDRERDAHTNRPKDRQRETEREGEGEREREGNRKREGGGELTEKESRNLEAQQ